MSEMQKRKLFSVMRYIAFGFAVVVTIAVGFWHAPLSLWLPETNSGVKITPISTSHMGQGSAIVDLSDISSYEANHSPIWVEWDWCPSGGLLNWCISASSSELDASAQVDGLSMTMEEIVITQLGARWLTTFAPDLIDFQLSGSLERVQITDLGCPSQGLQSGAGELFVRAIDIFGSQIDDHRIVINEGSGFNLSLQGDEAQGAFTVNNRHYAWSLEWQPSAEIASNPLLPASVRNGGEVKITDEAAILC